jgi:hypothetical protein
MLRHARFVLVVGFLSPAAASRATAQGTAVPVRGIAYDSLNRAPLDRAVITIVGTSMRTTADGDGRFRFDSVPPGTHTFAAEHAALDSLGFSGISTRATVTDGRAEVRLGSPSFPTLWRLACGNTPVPKDSGFVYGTIRDAVSGAPMPNVTVDATWLDLRVTRSLRLTELRWRARSVTTSDGNYALCGVPTDVGLRVIAATDSTATGLIELLPRDARVQRRDLLVGPVADDTIGSPRGTIVGVVTDSSGRPVPEARVVADGVPELRADSSGRFTVKGVPIGSRQVEVLAIGMSPVYTVVDVTPWDTARVYATMRRITTLDVVRVTASPNVRRLVRDFEERRKNGLGYLRDSTAIGVHGTMFSVLHSFPSVEAVRTGSGTKFIVLLPGRMGQKCLANLIIDGRRSDYDEFNFLRPSDVAAVEVYPRRMSAPMQFVRDDTCGVVVVWTKWAFGG